MAVLHALSSVLTMEEFSLDTSRNRLVKEHVQVLLAAKDKELLAITNILTKRR